MAHTPSSPHHQQGRLFTYTLPGGWKVLVGRTDADNEVLSFRVARPDDWWFHVILQGPPCAAPDRQTLTRAAAIAAYHSKARHAGVVVVSGTRARDVTKPRGAPAGTVQIRHEKVCKVRPARGDLAGEPGHAAPSARGGHRPGRRDGVLAMARLHAALAPCAHGRLRGRRAARDGLGRGRSRQTGGSSSSAADGSAKVMSCPKARRATPVATRPQSVAIPRSMAGTSQCSSRPRPSPHPQMPPRRSPHTVTQLSINGLALLLALVARWGVSRGHPAREYIPCVRFVQGHARHGRHSAMRRCEPCPVLPLGEAA